jgi:hypothetical protein
LSDDNGSQDGQQEERLAAQYLPSGVAEEAAERGLAEGIQIPIGAIILFFGLIILLTGVFSAPQTPGTNGVNMDLWWGLVMVVLGALFVGYGWLKSTRAGQDR